jgi:hypothetical protein
MARNHNTERAKIAKIKIDLFWSLSGLQMGYLFLKIDHFETHIGRFIFVAEKLDSFVARSGLFFIINGSLWGSFWVIFLSYIIN